MLCLNLMVRNKQTNGWLGIISAVNMKLKNYNTDGANLELFSFYGIGIFDFVSMYCHWKAHTGSEIIS